MKDENKVKDNTNTFTQSLWKADSSYCVRVDGTEFELQRSFPNALTVNRINLYVFVNIWKAKRLRFVIF